MTRIEVLKEFPNPDIRGGAQHGGLRFYPRVIITVQQHIETRKLRSSRMLDNIIGRVGGGFHGEWIYQSVGRDKPCLE